ncbi:acyl-CoA N-acyltransferase [Dipodascopsis tothii]|uniref:acyl-CoA N-acyltransferase n=1 Tax=Dipodascopsis tothii TaxID=44089 RepID=UPI0034CD6053
MTAAKSNIRRGTVADELVKALALYEKEPDAVLATEESLTKTLFGDVQYARVYIAETDDGVPAGMALYFYNYSTWKGKPGIYLEDLFVKPEYRGRGLGGALIAALAEELIAIDGGRLEWSVLKWNTPSIKFYESLGARAMVEWDIMRVDGDSLVELAKRSPGVRE